MGNRARQPDTIIAPIHPQRAAIHIQPHAPPGQAAQMRRHCGGAGPRPAGKGDAGAAFPHPHAQVVRGQQAGEFNIGALGKQRVMFDDRAKAGHRRGLGLGYEKHAMRVAHTHGGRRAVNRQGPQIGRAGQRHIGPFQQRRAHIYPNFAILAMGGQKAARGGNGDGVAPSFIQHQMRHTARGIATSPGAAAIIVPEIQPDIGGVMGIEFGQLVKPDPALGIAHGLCQFSRHPRPASARVDHYEMVACAVHLAKRQANGRHGLNHACDIAQHKASYQC